VAVTLLKIVSGGQTGADRGALDAAIDLHLDRGGWAPHGWRAEDGAIPEVYRAHMRQAATADWKTRTILNIQDSDGTLVFSFAAHLTGGSALTVREARRLRKPWHHGILLRRGAGGSAVNLDNATRAEILAWVAACQIRVLNVAGPRESKEPGIQRVVHAAVTSLLEDRILIASAAEVLIAQCVLPWDENDLAPTKEKST